MCQVSKRDALDYVLVAFCGVVVGMLVLIYCAMVTQINRADAAYDCYLRHGDWSVQRNVCEARK